MTWLALRVGPGAPRMGCKLARRLKGDSGKELPTGGHAPKYQPLGRRKGCSPLGPLRPGQPCSPQPRPRRTKPTPAQDHCSGMSLLRGDREHRSQTGHRPGPQGKPRRGCDHAPSSSGLLPLSRCAQLCGWEGLGAMEPRGGNPHGIEAEVLVPILGTLCPSLRPVALPTRAWGRQLWKPRLSSASGLACSSSSHMDEAASSWRQHTALGPLPGPRRGQLPWCPPGPLHRYSSPIEAFPPEPPACPSGTCSPWKLAGPSPPDPSGALATVKRLSAASEGQRGRCRAQARIPSVPELPQVLLLWEELKANI